MKYTKILVSVLLIISVLFSAMTVMGVEQYESYIYDEWDEAVPSANGYLCEYVINPVEKGTIPFSEAKDMYVKDDLIYLLDTGRGRIVIFNDKFEIERELTEFTLNGEASPLKTPNGIFVSKDNYLYIADTGNNRVIKSDLDGNIEMEYLIPDSNIYRTDQGFVPINVVVDSAGIVYVVATGIYEGAIMYEPDGTFTGYYGASKVQITLQFLRSLALRRFLTSEQEDRTQRGVPAEFTSFDIDSEDFVYTTSKNTQTEKVRKINPNGSNIFKESLYGDGGNFYYDGNIYSNDLIDICVDDKGFINILDFSGKKVFQYDRDENLVFIFGGGGYQKGTFDAPSAIDTMGDKILVLDSLKGLIYVYELTEFGQNVHTAVEYFNGGFYNEGLPYWEEVIKMNSNYKYAYVGIGKAKMYQDLYKEAAYNFRLGFDHDGYDKAFKEYRTDQMRKYFALIAIGGLLLLYLFVAVVNKDSWPRRFIKKMKQRKAVK